LHSSKIYDTIGSNSNKKGKNNQRLLISNCILKEGQAMPKYTRNSGKEWSKSEKRELKRLAAENTPTRVIGLKLGRTENAIRSRASAYGVSLKPVNRAPYNRTK
jgi:hypothetical protein